MSYSHSIVNDAIATQVPATCMGLHIRRASRILTQVYDAALRPTGLVVNQFTLLVAIHLSEPVWITQLAEGLFSDQTTVTRNVKLLEKQGLVAIAPGADRRIKLVSLTPNGKAILDQALPLWEQVQAELKHQIWRPEVASTAVTASRGDNVELVVCQGSFEGSKTPQNSLKLKLEERGKLLSSSLIEH